MLTVNKVSRYDVALAAVEGAKGVNQDVAIMAKELVRGLEKKIGDHASYIEEHGKGEDPSLPRFVLSRTLRELTKTHTRPRRPVSHTGLVLIKCWLSAT